MLGVCLAILCIFQANALTTCEIGLKRLEEEIKPIFMEQFSKLQIKPNEAKVDLIVTSIILQKAKIDPPTIDNCELERHVPCQIVCTAGGQGEVEFQAFGYQYKGNVKLRNIKTRITLEKKNKPSKVEITFPSNPEDVKFEIEDSWIFNKLAQYINYLLDYAKPYGEHEILKFLKIAYNKKQEL